MSGFKGTKIKELLRACSDLESGNYLGGNFTPSLVSVENEVDSLIKQHNEMLEMLEDAYKCLYLLGIEKGQKIEPITSRIEQLIKSATEL